MIFSKLNPYAFILAFCFGLFLVYITNPQPTVIVKYPTPDQAPVVFKDDADNCYKFNITETECPSDTTAIETIPVERKIEDFAQSMHQRATPMDANHIPDYLKF